MTSNYWIKLYHEILSDPKMGRLPDRLWRRTIELFLLAGENGQDGDLPSVVDMAWRLRISEDALQGDLNELSADGIAIVKQEEDEWFVTKFAKRQAAMPGNERMQRLRDAKRKEHYYGDEDVTNRHTDGDDLSGREDKIREDKIREDAREKKSRSSKTTKTTDPLFA